ncbi:GNAT family protein [Mammaliicoccus sciuri]|uniref:GNAT family N-acetyltransferase n=1 Tax=Mammaliicoccus sciuri TaxID=1296 RepID=UPI0018CAE9BE|nr:GNAT family protein [Mammaliicoccus sciuri]MBG9209508.1 GNAT family N-acetyltransferase [Mammaliicoccus sciuri]MCI8456675.1 GNAT family N-acetyltransferase [Mammaliicoccus sciuri]MDT0743818.1 GNAT family protein [Mammaliicoccus sciuri]MDT0751210.1 GNAT family protein [Mammaliicoccus sciuri]WQL32612.1 GNAT family protein [Mammaliicoccus sciuri]
MDKIYINQDLILRNAETKDIDDYLSVPFNKELLMMYGSTMDYRTSKSKEKAALLIKEIQNEPYEWAIVYQDKFIGQVRLVIDDINNKAKFAIGIFNPECWSMGIGTKVSAAVVNYGFEYLKLHKIYLRVLKYNARAIKAYEKVGFIIEGEERDSAFIKGEYYNDIHMGILKSEFNINQL